MLPVEGQKINSQYDINQGRVLICRQNFTVLDRTLNQGYFRFTLKSASAQQSTVVTEKARSPKRPLKPFDNILTQTTYPILASLGNFNEGGAWLPQYSERLEERV